MSDSAEETQLPDHLDEAVDWLILLRGGNLNEAQAHAFADWLSQDISHTEAFAKAEDYFNDMLAYAQLPYPADEKPSPEGEGWVTTAWMQEVGQRREQLPRGNQNKEKSLFKSPHPSLRLPGMEEVRQRIGNPCRLPEGEGGRAFKSTALGQPVNTLPKRISRRWLALPLALAAAWLFAVGLVLPSQSNLLDNLLSDYHTQTGELRDIQLTDGSHLLLNTNTAVSVDFQPDKRLLTLHHGQARFTVAKDAQRPFEVKTDKLIVRALGTVFDVYKKAPDSITVTVQEHAVAVRIQDDSLNAKAGNPSQVKVQAGQQLIYGGDGGLPQPTSVSLGQASAWQQRRLFINDRPLSELIAELDRYRIGRIYLANAQLKNLRVTGVFPLADADDALASVRKVLALQETRLGSWWVVLHR